MKSLLIAICFAFPTFLLAHSSPSPAEVDPPKEERHTSLLQLIENRAFVLQSTSLYNGRGQLSEVSPSNNFLSVDGTDATIQLMTKHLGLAGNDSSEVTLAGSLYQFELRDRGVGKGLHVRMTFSGSTLTDMVMEISDSGHAILDLTNLYGERVRMKGSLIALEDSHLYVDHSENH
ncbi:MAG: DUF4251 domain-containing protein [Bacteroidota bacterium]